MRIDKDIDRDGDNFDPFFDLVITATCKNYPSFQSNSTSTVVIRDINDNEPTFDQDIYDFEDIDEGYVGRLSDMDILISDPDSVETLFKYIGPRISFEHSNCLNRKRMAPTRSKSKALPVSQLVPRPAETAASFPWGLHHPIYSITRIVKSGTPLSRLDNLLILFNR